MEKPSNNRTNLLINNIIASFILKGWSALVMLAMVPLTLRMLGAYNNGVWLTISSILLWINLMDIGLGNGLRNAIASYIALNQSEKIKEVIASTFFMLAIVTLPILLIAFTVIYGFDMSNALGIDADIVQNLNTILIVAVTLTCGTFVCKAVGNFYMGVQLPAINNLIVCCGQTLSLVLTFIAYLSGSHSLLLVVLINTAAPLFVWSVSIPITFYGRYSHYRPSFSDINLNMSKSLCSVGIQFFLIQISAIVLFSSANIIISKMFSPSEVTPYQIAYRYFNIAFITFSTICMPFWNATTDAYTRGDKKWLCKMDQRLNILILGILTILIGMFIISPFIYKIWIGDSVTIPKSLSFSVAVYIFVLTLSQRYSYILNGLNCLKIQIIFTCFAAVIFLPLAWGVCNYFESVSSLVWLMCLVNLPGLIANMWKYHQVLFKKE
ncbi:hypothetical protein L6475_04680 [Prevotella sp. E9-3]|uniref:lipopolysaccharide biosynthesis protein n=1 Tax=Prevotella sp. E9-3 TaxID=2913621 RepID=UPI001EDBD2BC|nr:hypothetical protein [Prevotella sp. E9-3]UKK49259.1 hypothetical protein L6475_04680 [Prevotella sp. E9-3]